jgi:5-methylcytosine-specific restriction protein B
VAAVLGDATESEGSREGRFIDRVRLQPPKGMSRDEDSSARYRWKVRDAFSYEEFAAP